MALVRLSEDEILLLGLESVGFDERRQQNTCDATNMTRFYASFGAGPKSCIQILESFQKTEVAAASIKNPNITYFFMTLNWMKTYKTETEMAGLFKTDEKRARERIWKYVKAIQALKSQKVSFTTPFAVVRNLF